MIPARLILEDGEVYEGLSFAWQKETCFGEAVFTTGMTGYVESLTDPSFAGQILTFTYPLIGNYGVPEKALWESEKIWAAAVVLVESSRIVHHAEAKETLLEWLSAQKIPLICDIDTRALTKKLRKQGVALGAIATKKENPTSFVDPNISNLVGTVSCKEPILWGKGEKKIIAVDCGMKKNILRSLLQLPVTVLQVPYDYDYSEEDFDGIFLSNGPGDPTLCTATVEVLKKAMKRNLPLFGICLGAQIMALAIGASTYKLLYGHRGQNQPCIDEKTKRCYLTSQNHGFAIEEKSLPENWRVRFRNLNDGSIEGIEHVSLPFFSVQFHPEAAPGPLDTLSLFEQFCALL